MDALQPLVKSSFLQQVSDGSPAFIWHSLFGHPRLISTETLQFLEEFGVPRSLSEVATDYGVDVQELAPLEDLANAYFLVPPDLDERAPAPRT